MWNLNFMVLILMNIKHRIMIEQISIQNEVEYFVRFNSQRQNG